MQNILLKALKISAYAMLALVAFVLSVVIGNKTHGGLGSTGIDAGTMPAHADAGSGEGTYGTGDGEGSSSGTGGGGTGGGGTGGGSSSGG